MPEYIDLPLRFTDDAAVERFLFAITGKDDCILLAMERAANKALGTDDYEVGVWVQAPEEAR